MKIFLRSKFIVVLFVLVIVSVLDVNCTSQEKQSKTNTDTVSLKNDSNETDSNWYSKQEWLNGLNLNPHESINREEFSKQYHKNKTWWGEAFDFLKTRNLDTLQPGTYVIDSGNVIATVSKVSPKDKSQVNWEAHRDFNDLQYIISGKAEMGIAPVTGSGVQITVPYTKEGDTETFSVSVDEKYYTAEPGTFFIFSPKEIHRPAFKVSGYDTIKKIVIKVRVPQ